MRGAELLKGLVAIVASLLLVVGGAALLVFAGRLDVFGDIEWTSLFTTRDDGSLVLGLVTVIGWIAWGLLTASLLVDLVNGLTGRLPRRRIPLVGLFHPLTVVLATAILGMITHPPVVPEAVAALPGAPPGGQATTQTIGVVDDAPEDEQGVHHLTTPGDDLWSLAERYYGDGTRWRRLAEANRTLLPHDTDVLPSGVLLFVPDPTPPQQIVVAEGDTLSGLARTHLGDEQAWWRIAAANPELADPDILGVGMILNLPTGPDSAGEAARVGRTDPAEDSAAPGDSTMSDRSTSSGEPASSGESPGILGGQPATTAGEPGTPTDPVTRPQGDGNPVPVAHAPAPVLATSLFTGVMGAGLATAFAVRRRRQLAGRPVGFRLPALRPGLAIEQAVLASRAAQSEQSETVEAGATTVELGQDLRRDVVADAVTVIRGPDGLDISMANAIAAALAVDVERRSMEIVCGGTSFTWLDSLDEPLLTTCDSTTAVKRLEHVLAMRSQHLATGMSIADTDWPTMVFVVEAPGLRVDPGRLAGLGVAVVQCAGDTDGDLPGHQVRVDEQWALHDEVTGTFRPNLLHAPARRVLEEIFNVADDTQYPEAPWWDHSPAAGLPSPLTAAVAPAMMEVPSVANSPTTDSAGHPVVKLMGPVDLEGARGPTPARATKQCIEYAAWLLLHPGASASVMADALVVAETTRRSNMSRLRTWLGNDDAGEPYLPDAYTGRIMLHPAVTSDWEEMQILVSGGVNRATSEALRKGLELVRGAPLADAAPGQWVWAEQLRNDMSAMICDMGVVLARRSLAADDPQTARWAVERARWVAPDDESLLVTALQIAAHTGEREHIDPLVLQITRRARTMGVDLRPDTVEVLQQVVEGRNRPGVVS